MTDLLNKKCVPCEGGVSAFDISEIHKYQKKVDGWDVVKNKSNFYLLEKKFTFKNFIDSQNFVYHFLRHPNHLLFFDIYVFLKYQME